MSPAVKVSGVEAKKKADPAADHDLLAQALRRALLLVTAAAVMAVVMLVASAMPAGRRVPGESGPKWWQTAPLLG